MTSGEFILQCRDVEKLGSEGQAGLELDVSIIWQQNTVRDVKTLSAENLLWQRCLWHWDFLI